MPTHNASSAISSSVGIRRSYAPVSNTPSNVVLNSNTRKPRSYVSPTTSIMKA